MNERTKVYIIYDAYWGLFELDEVLIYTSKESAEKKYKELIEQNRYNEESHYMLIEKETDTDEKNAKEVLVEWE